MKKLWVIGFWFLVISCLCLFMHSFTKAVARDDPEDNRPTHSRQAESLPDYLQKEVDRLIKQLGDDSWEKREAATDELIRIGPRVRPAIEKVLEDPDPEIRERAQQIRLIMKWQEAFLSRLDKLIKPLRKGSLQDPNLIQWIIQFLGNDESVLLLVDVLKDQDQSPKVRHRIVDALKNIRISLKPIVPELVDIWKQEKEPSMRLKLMHVFGKVGADVRIKPLILEAAQGNNYNLRVNAISALGQIGDHSVILELFKFLGDPDNNIRNTALYALNCYRVKTVADGLFELLREETNLPFKRQIMVILAHFEDKRLLSEVLQLIKTEKDKQLLQVIFGTILPRYGKEPSVIPVLMDCLKQGDTQMRKYAIGMLEKRREKTAIPEIINLLEKENDFSSFNSLAASFQVISGQRVLPQTVPEELRGIVMRSAVPTITELLKKEKNFNSFNKFVTALQALSGKRFLPQTVPEELKATVLVSAREWWAKNK